MRRSTRMLLGVALPYALIFPFIAGAPAMADSTTSAEFTRATCLGAMDDLAKVDVMAREKNWATAPEAAAGAQNNAFKMRSAWSVTQGDDKFLVATGDSHVGGNVGTGTLCMVMFPGKNVRRDEFFTTMSAGMELTSTATMSFPQGYMEIYEIKSSGPNKQILQMMSLNDGTLMLSSLMSMTAPPTPPAPVVAAATAVDGSVRAFRARDAHTVYVLGSDGNLWCEFGTWDNAEQPRIQVDGSVSAFQALDADVVFVLGSDGNLWRELGTAYNAQQPRVQVDRNVKAFQAIDSTVVYVLGKDSKLWRQFDTASNAEQPRQNVDGQVSAFQALDADTVYVLGSDKKLWREFGTWNNAEKPRQNIDREVRAFQAVDADVVYVLGTDGNLWREFGTGYNAQQPRVQVDGSVKAFQALDATTVYVLGSDGNLWLEQGTMQTRKLVATGVLGFQAIDDHTAYVLCPGEILFRVAMKS
jgi:hypothetical protein